MFFMATGIGFGPPRCCNGYRGRPRPPKAGGYDGYRVMLRTVSVFVWLQEKAEDHQGAVLVKCWIVDHTGAFVATGVV